MRIVLNAGQKTYVLDAPLGDPPPADAPEEVKNVYLSQKEHQVLMVNKTTSFKKQGKPKKGNFKKGGKKAAAPPKKPKAGPKPDTECFYCKGDGYWKRNCPKYLADLKNGNIKKKGIFDIYVIDVYLKVLIVVPGYLILVRLLIFVTRNRNCGINEYWQETR